MKNIKALYLTRAILLMLGLFGISGISKAQHSIFNCPDGSYNIEQLKAQGWTIDANVSSDASGVLLNKRNIVSPVYEQHDNLVLTLDYGTVGSWEAYGMVSILNATTDEVIFAAPRFSVESYAWRKGQTIQLGNATTKFKLKIENTGEGLQIANFSLQGLLSTTRVEVDKRTLDFGSIKQNTSKVLTLALTPFFLKSDLTISSDNPAFAVTPISIANGTTTVQEITVKFLPTLAQAYSGNITIVGTDINETISLTGTGLDKNAPTLIPSIKNLDFGVVGKDNTRQLSFMVSPSNLTGDLTIASLNEYFTVSPQSIPANTIVPTLVTVTFLPKAVQSYSGEIHITGTNIDEKVILSGTGYVAVLPPLTVAEALVQGVGAGGTVSGYILGYLSSPDGPINTYSKYNIAIADASGEKDYTKMFVVRLTTDDQRKFAATTASNIGKQVTVSGPFVNTPSTKNHLGIDVNALISIEYSTPPIIVSNPSVTVNHSSLSFGEVEKGKKKELVLTVTPADLDGELQIVSDNGAFLPSSSTVSGSWEQTITIAFTPNREGDIIGHISLSGKGINHTIAVSGKGVASAPDVVVEKSTLAFGDVELKVAKELTVTLTPSDLKGDLTITSNNAAFAVSLSKITAETTETQTLTVTFTPVAEIDYTGEISVVGTGINKTIMLSGKGVLLPVIITSEQSLTFGRVAIGTPSTKKVKITVANLKENVQLVPSNNSFSVSPAVITKDLSGEQEVSITVTPKQSGDITADIDVMYAGQKVKTITSSAVGFQPTAIDFGTTTQLDFEAVAINSSKTLTFNVTPSHINGS
ncbi:MAG: DUF6359 domain-containing protein, partial [Bacteroidaceae bacterium]